MSNDQHSINKLLIRVSTLDSNQRKLAYIDLFNDLKISENNRINYLQKFFDRETNLNLKYLLKRMISTFNNGLPAPENLNPRIENVLKYGDHSETKQLCVQILRTSSVQYLSLIEQLSLRFTDPFFRLVHLRLLAILQPLCLQNVIDYLDDNSEPVIVLAIQLLAKYPRLDIIIKLGKLLDSKSKKVHYSAQKVLKDYDKKYLVSELNNLLLSKSNSDFDIALVIIQKINLKESINTLLGLLDSGALVRQKKISKTLQIMAQIGNSSFSSNSKNAHQISSKDQLDGAPKLNFFEFLKNQVEDGTSSKSIATALLALSQVDGDRIQKTNLFRKYSSHPDPRIRANAIEALSVMMNSDSEDIFQSFLEDENNRVRGNAILALSKSKNFIDKYLSEVRECLRFMIQDERVEWQLTSLYCIGIIQDPSLLRVIEEILYCKQFKATDRAIQVLQTWSCVYPSAGKVIVNFEQKNFELDVDVNSPEVLLNKSLHNLVVQGFSIEPVSEDYFEAKKYLSAGKIDLGMSILRDLINNQDHTACEYISSWYLQNSNHEKFDQKQLIFYANLGAQNGNSNCMYILAECYRVGWGCNKDYTQWLNWLRHASDNNSAQALFRIGNIYDSGCLEGYPRDLCEAYRYYRDSAVMGHLPAMFCLASMFLLQEGTKQDIASGWLWLKLSSSFGSEQSSLLLRKLEPLLNEIPEVDMYSCCEKWLCRSDLEFSISSNIENMLKIGAWRRIKVVNNPPKLEISEKLIKALQRPLLPI